MSKLMDFTKEKLRDWLELDKGMNPLSIRIIEPMSFEANVFKNQIWYRGDPSELHQFYTSIDDMMGNTRFWQAVATNGVDFRKIHTGLPGLIIDVLADIVFDDMNAPEYFFKDAFKQAMYLGDGAVRFCYHPLTKQQVDFSKTALYTWTNEFFDELKKKRKFALRMGKLADAQACYTLKPEIVRQLCLGSVDMSAIKEKDFIINIDQKGVDMKIGLDIASLAYKKQVDQIILISGDSDFVSAAKLARREGIDFILDPLGANIKPDLFEHIDGLMTCDKIFLGK